MPNRDEVGLVFEVRVGVWMWMWDLDCRGSGGWSIRPNRANWSGRAMSKRCGVGPVRKVGLWMCGLEVPRSRSILPSKREVGRLLGVVLWMCGLYVR